ncbi:hypothetical protein SDC9_134036 [bioreactor metagenome]|uniref:Uncharacterized protein n=1 Tax=bioreactor metagenome TaxID=1076179 RepID=A0A645DDN4_9ZZZZ
MLFGTTPVSPITYTFFTFNLLSSFMVSFVIPFELVKSTGALFFFAKGAADNASAYASPFATTAYSAPSTHPALETSTAVKYLSLPDSLWNSTLAADTWCAGMIPAISAVSAALAKALLVVFFM